MNWKKVKSDHYIFNYPENSLAENDNKIIISLQEFCFSHICQVLQVKPSIVIEYYFYDSPEELGEIYGDNEPANAFTKMPNKIYAVYNEKIKCIGYHEDAHLISYNTINRPKSAFIREGLAMFFDQVWWGIPNKAWVKEYKTMGVYPELNKLMDNEQFYQISCVLSYPIAGAFAEYLILTFGINHYKKFYEKVNSNIMDVFKEIFTIELNSLERDYLKWLNSFNYSDKIKIEIENQLSELKINSLMK